MAAPEFLLAIRCRRVLLQDVTLRNSPMWQLNPVQCQSVIVDGVTLSPAEKPTKHGLIFAATPASDIVCGPSQVASGIGLQVFMTGRGTPYGLDVTPVIKVCSRNEMKAHWFDLIDVSAGPVATGEANIADVGTEIFNLILDVASGLKEPYSDQYGFHNDMCIFNPAPIT